MARLIIPVKSVEQLEHIFRAENQLLKAGISFDTGSDLRRGKVLNRCWELDFSLEGAKVK